MNAIESPNDQPKPPVLVDKGGVLVLRGELPDNLSHITRRERCRRVADLMQRIESDWGALAWLAEVARLAYDEEADVLYVNFKKPSRADDSELTDDDIIIRYENEQVVGMTILNASHRQPAFAAARQPESAAVALAGEPA
jgi:uncharacterized protein YuzE